MWVIMCLWELFAVRGHALDHHLHNGVNVSLNCPRRPAGTPQPSQQPANADERKERRAHQDRGCRLGYAAAGDNIYVIEAKPIGVVYELERQHA